MIQFDSPGTDGDGGIYFRNLPSWMTDVSSASAEAYTILMRVWRTGDAAEVGTKYRTVLNLFDNFGDHINIGTSKFVTLSRVVHSGGNPALRSSAGGLSAAKLGQWVWVMVVIDPTAGVGNPLEVSYGQVTASSAASLTDNSMRVTDATSGVQPNVGDLVFTSSLQLEIGHDFSFQSQHCWDGMIDTLTVLGDTILTTADLQALQDSGERFPYRLTSGNFPGPTHPKTLWTALSPIDNPTNRDTISGVVGPLMGDTLDSAADVCMYSGAYSGAIQAGKTHVYWPQTIVENGGGEVPMVFIRPDGPPSIPSSGTAAGTVVNSANNDAKAIRDYITDGTAPTKQHIVAYGENSRGAGGDTITVGNRLWARNGSMGFCVQLWSEMVGMAFKPAYLLANQAFGFQQPSPPWTSGSPSNVGNTTEFLDLARFGTGGNLDSTDGPGGGIALESSDAFTVYVDDMTAANLPSAMLDLFGASGEYDIATPMAGDSRLVKGTPVTLNLFYLMFPGGGTFQAVAVESSSVATTGTTTGYSSGAIDTSTPDLLNHSWRVGTDTYDAGTRTLTFGATVPPALADIEVGHSVHHAAASTFGGINCVVSKTANSLTLKHALSTAPTTGSVLHAGTWGYGKETSLLPASSLRYRGFRVTGSSGVSHIVGQGCVVPGVDGFSVGMFGKSGAGWGEQIDNQAHDDVPGLIMQIAGIETVFMGPANQSSTPARTNEYADNLKSVSNAIKPAFMANPMNELEGGTTEFDYDSYMMGQTKYPASTAYLSLLSGDLESKVADGQQSNDPHPGLSGHVWTVQGHFQEANWVPENTTTIRSASQRLSFPSIANNPITRSVSEQARK